MNIGAPIPNQPHISVVTATAVVVANMVGTGVFTSLGFQVSDIPSGFALVLLWIVGGICALCGAVAYGELAAALPRSGGEYHFLSAIFHPSIGFIAGWTSATVGFAAPLALSAMALGHYFQAISPMVQPWVLSIAVVGATSAVHLCGVSAGSAFQNGFTWLKVALIFVFVFAGLLVGHPQPISFLPVPTDTGVIFSAPFAIGLVYVMYSYSGWNASTYIVAEVRDPRRNVPRSLVSGTLIVMTLYVALNAVFLYTTPVEKLRDQLEVGVIAGNSIFGRTGGQFMAALICLVLISSISSMTWVGPRVAMMMGEDVRALKFLSHKTSRGVPAVAICLQLLLVNALLLTTSFQIVLICVQFTLILCSFLTVAGMMLLRHTHPELPRPYKTWSYPVTPLIFLAISFFMMASIAKARPMESIAGLGTMMLGLVVYFGSPKAPRIELTGAIGAIGTEH